MQSRISSGVIAVLSGLKRIKVWSELVLLMTSSAKFNSLFGVLL